MLWKCPAVLCLVAQLCLTLCDPMDCSLPGSSVHGDSPDKNTGMACHALLQGIFPTQGSNPGLPYCRWILYHLNHQGSPGKLKWVAYPFSRGPSWPSNWTSVSCIAGGFFTSWTTREGHALEEWIPNLADHQIHWESFVNNRLQSLTLGLWTQDLYFQSSPDVFDVKSNGKTDAKCLGGKDNSCIKAIFFRKNIQCVCHMEEESNSTWLLNVNNVYSR